MIAKAWTWAVMLRLDLRAAARTLVRRGILGAARDDSAATAIEYGLIAAGIGLAVAAVVFAFGNNIEAYYQAIDDRITDQTLT